MMQRIREWLPESSVSSDFIVGFSGETEEEFKLTCDAVREFRFKNSFIFKYSERPGTVGAKRYPDDIAEEVKKRRNNELLAIQNQISEEDNHAFLGRRVEILVEGPSKWSEKGKSSPSELTSSVGGLESQIEGSMESPPGTENVLPLGQPGAASEGWNTSSRRERDPRSRDSVGSPAAPELESNQNLMQLTGRTLCDRIVVFQGQPRLIGQFVEIGIYDVSPFTLLGTILTHHQTPQLMQLQ
jgi:tRNA-2-methylthio-N6-dimethylallyladenosine synthase